MSSGFDQKTSTFSQSGRLLQVEYAMESIKRAPLTLALQTTQGIVFASERRPKSDLVAPERPEIKDINGEKVYKLDEHMGISVAGLAADANLLVDHSRSRAQQHLYTYAEPIPIEDLCQLICDIKQGYTQFGSNRPFGVSFLIGGWDRHHGFQLYNTDPSGNYAAWKAYAIGANEGAAQGMLKQDWTESLSLEDGVLLALKVLGKTLDAVSLTPKLVEVAVLSRAPKSAPRFHILTDDELVPKIAGAEAIRKREDEEREERRKRNAAENAAAAAQ